MIRDPIEIFNYMNSEGIGTKFAGYYESWALALENAQNNKQADEVYQLGIARKAEPVGRLERRQRFAISYPQFFRGRKGGFKFHYLLLLIE